jgi:hypothetical protein
VKKKASDEFPMLREFMRGYLHQDIVPEHGTPQAAARAYLADLSDAERDALANEVRRMKTTLKNLTPAEYTQRVSELGGTWNFDSPAQFRQLLELFQ